MRTSRWLAVSVLAFSLAGLATARQLAMLVEVAPRGVVDEGTLTEITVRIAPEDRIALSEDAMLWVELSREETRVLRRGWALKIDDPDKPITVEIVIPDGPHVLRVDLKGAGNRSSGVWWGDVDVSVSSSPASEDASVPDPDPVPAPDDSDSEQRQQTAAAAATATASVVESAAVPEPDAATDTVPEPVGEGFSPRKPGADEVRRVNDRPAGSEGFSSGRDELTVFVIRDGAAVPGLTADRFAVSVGGETIPATCAEGPGEGVTHLRIAVDLGARTSAETEWVTGLVARLATIVSPSRGSTVVGDIVGRFSAPVRFDADASDTSQWVVSAEHGVIEETLPDLVLASLEHARSVSGKSFLAIVTDGRGTRGGKIWKTIHRAAAESGVPVLIAGIWQEEFGSGLRKDLRKLANETGGTVFYMQGPSQVDDCVERFGAVIGGAYAVCVAGGRVTGKVEVDLVGGGADIRSAPAIRRNSGGVEDRPGRARGAFVYFADAASFTRCGAEDQLPVSMEADYLAAERAYLEARAEPMAPVLMTVEGRIEQRPPMEGDGLIDMFVIDRFVAVHPGRDCDESPTASR
jgi:hypothetical protein